MIRPRGGTTRRRDDQQEQAVATIVEIGKRLQGAREERGLSLLVVHDRLSRPITQLEALENGDLASLPDQALAISTLRRYATFLEEQLSAILGLNVALSDRSGVYDSDYLVDGSAGTRTWLVPGLAESSRAEN